MKHGSTCPRLCSQCAGAVPRVIANDGPLVTVDGESAGRTIDRSDEIRRRYARHGGVATRRKARI